MANLVGETTKVSRMVLVFGNKEYELDGGGGGGLTPGVPIPADTVDSAAIQNGAVQMEDLNDDVKGKIRKTYDEDDETLHMDFDEMDVNNSRQDVGQGGGEDSDDDEVGFDTGVEDGSDDI